MVSRLHAQGKIFRVGLIPGSLIVASDVSDVVRASIRSGPRVWVSWKTLMTLSRVFSQHLGKIG
jgi:hypothetical protein